MVRIAAAVSFCVLVAANAFAGLFAPAQEFHPATPEELALKDVSYAPGAAAVILDWVEIDDDTRSYSAEYYRIKILGEEGKKYADVEVPYDAGFPVHARVTDISARTIQPDGTIVPFDGKIYDKVLYKSGGVRVRARAFSLPAVQVGSILEYRFQRRWAERMLLNTLWRIQREVPVLRARMSIRPHPTDGMYESSFTYHNLPPGRVPMRTRDKTYDFELTNVPACQPEELAPPEESLMSRVHFYYTLGQMDALEFWSKQAGGWNKSIESFIGKVDAGVARPLLGKDPMETLHNIYAKVQSFKNRSFDDSSADEKKNASDVIAKAEGSRNEINRAFVALARAAGLEANVVRVAPRDRFFFSANVLDAEQMDGEIAVVTIDGQTHTFDPGTPTAPFGLVSWEKSNVPGVRIAKGAKPAFTTWANQKPEQAVMRRSADLRLNGDMLEGTITATFTGQEALVRRLRAWGGSDAERTKQLEDEAKEWFPSGSTVKLVQVTGATSHAEPLVAKFDVTLVNVVSAAGSRTALPISVFAASAKNPFSSATRTYPIYFKFSRRHEDDVKVTLPESLTLSAVPEPAMLDAGALQYRNEIRQNGNVIVFTRSMSVDTMLVDQQYYTPVRNFFSSMVAADQKPLLLTSQ